MPTPGESQLEVEKNMSIRLSTVILLLISASYPDEKGLDHAVGFPALGLATVTIDGRLNDSHNVIAELQLAEK